MGRYYSGDINGKFWFGVQPSDDASYFGGAMHKPNFVNFSFGKDDLPTIKEGIEKCKEVLADDLEKLNKFFDENNGYNDTMLEQAGIDRGALEWYARLDLGEQILERVENHAICEFEAEL